MWTTPRLKTKTCLKNCLFTWHPGMLHRITYITKPKKIANFNNWITVTLHNMNGKSAARITLNQESMFLFFITCLLSSAGMSWVSRNWIPCLVESSWPETSNPTLTRQLLLPLALLPLALLPSCTLALLHSCPTHLKSAHITCAKLCC
jgi:hypothetical protein